MPRQMLCTGCARTAAPDLCVAGSDLLELVLWVFFLAPGLLYLIWRHANRRRICAACGSSDLAGESQFARERRKADPAAPATPAGRTVYASRHYPWLATPSERLRRLVRAGGATAAAAGVLGMVWVNTVAVEPDAPRPGIAVAEPRDEGELEKERARRVQSRRERECERLCTEFHQARAHGHRGCMENCVAKLFDEPVANPDESACGELLDPAACELVAGPGEDAADPLAHGTLTDLPKGR